MSIAFDYVIVGGGSAGCVMAHRLSADPLVRVLLIEAGIDTPPDRVPAAILDSYPMGLFHGDRYIWPGLKAQIGLGIDGAPVVRAYEQGRVMGGSSSINVQAANRGLPRDYDEWAELGAIGWSWSEVLPYFRKLERDLDCTGPLHGHDGPVPIRRIGEQDFPAFARAVARAFGKSGLELRTDQNGEFGDGLFPPAFSNENDRRVSSAQAYLDAPTRARPNLTVWPESRVTRLLLEGRRARGVELLRNGVRVEVAASRIVLCAGALQTPAMLLRAGIGAGSELAALGIDTVLDLPGVGRNLRDHPALTLCQYLPKALRLPMDYRRASFLAMRFSSGLEGGSPSDMYVTASARAGWHALGQRLGLYFMWCNRPHSHGRVSLVSSDPDVYPHADLNLLSDSRDLRRLMDCVRTVAQLVVDPSLNPDPGDLFPAGFTPRIKRLSAFSRRNAALNAVLGTMLDVPARLRQHFLRTFMSSGHSLAEIIADESRLEDFVRRSVFGVWHASGTCRMGSASDRTAVVDPTGKVIGCDNIFVADASVMPRLPTANTNIPVIMIAEKIADGLTRRGGGRRTSIA